MGQADPCLTLAQYVHNQHGDNPLELNIPVLNVIVPGIIAWEGFT